MAAAGYGSKFACFSIFVYVVTVEKSEAQRQREMMIGHLEPPLRAVIERVLARALVIPHEAHGVAVPAFHEGLEGFAVLGGPKAAFLYHQKFRPSRNTQNSVRNVLSRGTVSGNAHDPQLRIMPVGAMDIFKLLASGDNERQLAANSQMTVDKTLELLIQSLPETATRDDLVAAYVRHYHMEPDKADEAIHRSDIGVHDARFLYHSDDPVYRVFNVLQASADNLSVFWHSLYGALHRIGHDFPTAQSGAVRNFLEEHVPPGLVAAKLDMIKERGRDIRSGKIKAVPIAPGAIKIDNLIEELTLRQQVREAFKDETGALPRPTSVPGGIVTPEKPAEAAKPAPAFKGIAITPRKPKR